jgi:hypothetical protein
MKPPPPLGWTGFFVQFFFGAIFGAIMGAVVLGHSPHAGSPSSTPALFYIGIGALACGLFAGFCGDDFWRGQSQ